MINVYIVSGFLGAGKTTFIQKLLREKHFEKVMLLENEFGEVGVDGAFFDSSLNIREINNGCICCSLQGDFEEALHEIEAMGVSDLLPCPLRIPAEKLHFPAADGQAKPGGAAFPGDLAEHGFRHALRQAAAKLPHSAPVQADEPVFQRGVMIRIPHHADPGLIPFLEAGAQGHVHVKIKALHQLGQEIPRLE